MTRYSRKLAPELQTHTQLYRFPTWMPGEIGIGNSECFVLLSISWYSGAPCRYFWSKMGPVPENLPFRADFHRGLGRKSCEIVCENHKSSLGFNWYSACGDDGKLDSKNTKFRLVFVGFPLLFRRIPENCRRSINLVEIALHASTHAIRHCASELPYDHVVAGGGRLLSSAWEVD